MSANAAIRCQPVSVRVVSMRRPLVGSSRGAASEPRLLCPSDARSVANYSRHGAAPYREEVS